MEEPSLPEDAPSREVLDGLFSVYEVRREGDRVRLYGDPLVPEGRLMEDLWPRFRDRGYEIALESRLGETVLTVSPRETESEGIPWTNVVLAVATVGTTLFAGTRWYHVPIEGPLSLLTAWPFAAAVVGVLGIHELGHYALSRHHGVDASLPYFIPVPTLIGTLGAVIRLRGRMPDREALFDVGVAGPLAGLAATVVVAAIGLTLPPVSVPPGGGAGAGALAAGAAEVRLGFPPLLHGIAWLLGEPLRYSDPTLAVNPVVVGAWVGAFVTFLNLLPVGQLDGGHVLRAAVGKRQAAVAKAVPPALFGLAGLLFLVDGGGNAVGLWLLWGVLALLAGRAGSASPVVDRELGRRRKALAALTFLLGALAFTPVPIQIGV